MVTGKRRPAAEEDVNDEFDVTRREFVRAAAITAAAAGLGVPLVDETAVAQTGEAAGRGGNLAGQPEEWAIDGGRASVKGPAFPYGAVYFRKSNPPAEDWARDHATAARVGMNTFRHWFLWSAIEVAPGKFDWADYDRMMDLAAANGLKVVIAEFTTCAPEWAFRQYAHARYQANDGIAGEQRDWREHGGGWISRAVPGQCGCAGGGGAISDGAGAAVPESSGAAGVRPLEREYLRRRRREEDELLLRGARKQQLREWLQAKYGTLAAAGQGVGTLQLRDVGGRGGAGEPGRICGESGLAGVSRRRCVPAAEVAGESCFGGWIRIT